MLGLETFCFNAAASLNDYFTAGMSKIIETLKPHMFLFPLLIQTQILINVVVQDLILCKHMIFFDGMN